jgi:lysophospholipase L1-like esterase
VASYRKAVTVKSLLDAFGERVEDRPRWVVVQAPKGDAELTTPLAQYWKQVEELIAVARQNQVRPILVTIAVLDNDPAGERSRMLEPYNEALRAIARTKGVPLADINKAMAERHGADPACRLTYDGERFNHPGAILMADALMRAMGLGSRITPRLRKVWAERPSYTDRYRRKKGSPEKN